VDDYDGWNINDAGDGEKFGNGIGQEYRFGWLPESLGGDGEDFGYGGGHGWGRGFGYTNGDGYCWGIGNLNTYKTS